MSSSRWHLFINFSYFSLRFIENDAQQQICQSFFCYIRMTVDNSFQFATHINEMIVVQPFLNDMIYNIYMMITSQVFDKTVVFFSFNFAQRCYIIWTTSNHNQFYNPFWMYVCLFEYVAAYMTVCSTHHRIIFCQVMK